MGKEKQRKVLIIAEIGHNHNGDMELAKKMIRKAKECGADIAKFQVYDTDTLGFSEEEKAKGVYDDLKMGELTKDQLIELKEECDKIGIEFFASAFDIERVGWLEEVGIKRHKIASRMIKEKEFIEALEKTGKPIIASLGWWKEEKLPDIKGEVDYLFCVAEYPTLDKHIKDIFPEMFVRHIGFSDHTLGTKWAKRAIVNGARIIEKHFTLDKNMFGCDQKGSAEPHELIKIVDFAKEWIEIWQ